MPIEFHCTNCSKLLRTPAENAGKKAKCPQCGAIADVPADPANVEPAATMEPARPRSPFGDSPVANESEAVNPYASPTHAGMPDMVISESKGELVHRQISFDSLLRQSWAFFKENLQPIALFGLVVLGITAGVQFIMIMAGFAVGAAGVPEIVVAFQVINQVVTTAVQTYVSIGSAIYSSKLVRNGDAQISDFFQAGHFFWRGLGVTLLVTLMWAGIVFVCLIPALATFSLVDQALTVTLAVVGGLLAVFFVVMIWYRYGILSYYFLVDRNTTVGEALSLSAQYMAGNKLTAFVVRLVVTFLWILLVLVTCGVGFLAVIIFFAPYQAMIGAMIYLTATGQNWAVARME